jgi:hypothetical protein
MRTGNVTLAGAQWKPGMCTLPAQAGHWRASGSGGDYFFGTALEIGCTRPYYLALDHPEC